MNVATLALRLPVSDVEVQGMPARIHVAPHEIVRQLQQLKGVRVEERVALPRPPSHHRRERAERLPDRNRFTGRPKLDREQGGEQEKRGYDQTRRLAHA